MHAIDTKTRTRGVGTGDRLARIVVAAGVVLFVGRGIDRVVHPAFWAEDGAQFFSEQISRGGLDALTIPYAGYLHVIPRLTALVFSPVPFTLAPLLYAVTAVVVALGLFSIVLSPRLAWLLPTPRARAVAFTLLCVSPVLSEVYGNIANLIFVGGVGLFLIAMCDDPTSRGGRAAEVVVVALLATSGPVVVLLLPVLIYRWWRVGRSAQSAVVAAVAIAGAVMQTIIYASSSRTTPGGGSVEVAVRAVIERVAGGWLFGFSSLFHPDGGPLLPTVVATAWIVAAFAVTVVVLRRDAVAPWFSLLALTGAASYAYGAIFVSGALAGQRHLVTPVAIVIVLLVAAASRSGSRAGRGVAVVCLVLGVLGVVASLYLSAHPDPADLRGLTNCRETAARLCSTPIAPSGWGVYLSR
ncbi:hypothetical protein ACQ7HM_06915 [Williamsia sp. MIQD14]|uniref:hypothetical protein n=1 Tax=Williamsia sp. MIQD14 TaxID=3425703 RepID=UPI003DA0618E